MQRTITEPASLDIRPVWQPRFNWNAVVLCSFLLVPFSELRFLSYSLFGHRTVSGAILVFLAIIGLDFVKSVRDEGFVPILRRMRPVAAPFAVYAAFMVHKVLFWSSWDDVGPTALYTLIGGWAVMMLSFLALSKQNERSITVLLFRYCIIFTFFFLSAWILERLFDFRIVLRAMDLVALKFPYLFRPYQYATLGAVVLLLGVGATLSLRKWYALYFIVPVITLAVAQSGNRSVMWLLVAMWMLMVLYLSFSRQVRIEGARIVFRHLLAVTFITVVLLALLIDEQGLRATSLLDASPLDLLTGAADEPRRGMWFGILKNYLNGTPLQIVVEGSARNLHNVYLDMLIDGGPIALFLFVTFLAIALFGVTRAVWSNKSGVKQPFYVGLWVSLLLVLGEFYANPMLNVPYVWVFFGLTMAILCFYRSSQPLRR